MVARSWEDCEIMTDGTTGWSTDVQIVPVRIDDIT